jgi:hypothetical protein
MTSNGLKPEIEAAYFAGREAGKRNAPVTENPYADKALFDPDQLASVWLTARKDAMNARYVRTRQRAWNRA